MKSGDQTGSMVLRGNEPRPFFPLVVSTPFFKMVRLAEMDPGMVLSGPRGKVLKR